MRAGGGGRRAGRGGGGVAWGAKFSLTYILALVNEVLGQKTR